MDPIEVILSRRSIQRYTTQPVSDEVIKELLGAAMSAPSAGDKQPWHFIVIHDRRALAGISKLHPNAQMVNEAPVAVVVCGDEQLETYMGLWVQDCSVATENLLLAAHAKGLGTAWVRIFPVKELIVAFRKFLNTPKYVVPFSLIPVGYPAEQKPPANRYSSSRVRYNTW